MGAWKNENGNTVTVYSRYFFTVPVRGMVRETNHDSFKVDFFTNNPGGHNVNKQDGKWFLKGQCKVDEIISDTKQEPEQPIIKKSGGTWVARFDGVDWMCVEPSKYRSFETEIKESFIRLIKETKDMNGIWKLFPIEITDEIAKLRPMVKWENNIWKLIHVQKNGSCFIISYDSHTCVPVTEVLLATVTDLD